jgi:hypothetical protein
MRAFRSLLQDDSPHVRGWVAAGLLAQGDVDALPVIEKLTADGGLVGFDAEMVLREHNQGRLGSPFGARNA